MKIFVYSSLISVIAAALTSSLSAEEGPLAAKIDAYVVTLAPDSTESLQIAEVANPGDIILYRAVFVNTSEAPLQDVKPIVPIPAALDYIVDSAKPTPAEASLDGVAFQAYPIKDAEGAPVAAASYRAFRWQLAAMKPGAPFTAELRARLRP